jgi:hypothetical protein
MRLFLEIEIWISWIIALPNFLSAWFGSPSAFHSLHQSKLVWMGVTLLGFIPFIGFIPAEIYHYRVWRHFSRSGGTNQPYPRPGPRTGPGLLA